MYAGVIRVREPGSCVYVSEEYGSTTHRNHRDKKTERKNLTFETVTDVPNLTMVIMCVLVCVPVGMCTFALGIIIWQRPLAVEIICSSCASKLTFTLPKKDAASVDLLCCFWSASLKEK